MPRIQFHQQLAELKDKLLAMAALRSWGLNRRWTPICGAIRACASS